MSRMPYETMFYMNNVPDTREFFGKQIWWGRMLESKEYNAVIADILEKNPSKNGIKNNHTQALTNP
jgi:hypothetical protein